VFFASTAGLAYVSHKGTSGPAVDSGVMQNFPADRSVPQVPGASSVPGAASSVPGAGSAPAPAPASKPDASVPSAPAAAGD
ncbi:preprotein translocase subunit SecG, partial [Achromobacter xylosoxidans]|nr:preprotein translocase subunit SecG [Achromobacter xylosoxidans]